jgi:hypothetical protein
MTQRPRAVVAVAIWVGLLCVFNLVPIVRSLTGYIGPAAGISRGFAITELATMVLMTMLVVSLVQLRALGIWATVAVVGLSAASSLLKLPTLLISGASSVAIIWVVTVLIFSGLATWYLSRPAFLSIAARFRAERHLDALRRHAERQVHRSVGP